MFLKAKCLHIRFDSNTVAALSDATNLNTQGSRLTDLGNALSSMPLGMSSSSLGVTVPPPGVVLSPSLGDPELNQLSQTLGTDGIYDRSDAVRLLHSAGDFGIVDATEFADLQTLVSPKNPVAVPEYVRVLANKVVNGDRANQGYQQTVLGNLAPNSSAEHLEKLVQKWFYGSDRPVTKYAYQAAAGLLFKEGVDKKDVRQGIVANCYFTAAAGVACRNPQAIELMFVDNRDGTYTIRFFNKGVADYVTVDRYLLSTQRGTFIYSNMSARLDDPSNELWVALLEKAYAQLNESGWIGQDGTNSYSRLGMGLVSDAMEHLTGQAASDQKLNQGEIAAALQAGEVVTVNTLPVVNSASIVPEHVYLVTSYNPATRTFSLYNPWGVAGNKDGNGVFKPGILELGWGEIQTNFDYTTRSAA